MADRVDVGQVKEIIETSLTDSEIQAFIKAANLTVTSLLGSSTALSDDQRTEIERWLAAHMLASTRERQIQIERVIGNVENTYVGKTGLGLDSTYYGQQVKILDVSGLLASAGTRLASIYAVVSFDEEDEE